MNLIDKLNVKMQLASDVLGIDVSSVEQRSPEWHAMRLGVITASDLKGVLAKKGSDTRKTALHELIAEIDTRLPKELISAKALQWGLDNEPFALEEYSFITGAQPVQVPFIYGDETMRFGCSPDGVGIDRTLEVKCPIMTRHHIEALLDGTIKKEYMHQVQMQMLCSGTQVVDFVSFDPRSRKRLHVLTIERDDKLIDTIVDAIGEFSVEVDRALLRLDLKFGDQWVNNPLIG
ncbi:exonuclease [Yersinia phage PY100]|nr:exonuclease [Yersinia phage PY100]